jgi:MFS family permease
VAAAQPTPIVVAVTTPRTSTLWQAAGGGRYAFALLVDALGAGLLRPFLLLYAIGIEDLSVSAAGVALSAGLLAGLAVLPAAGRWVDRGARRGPVVATLLVRTAGLAVLVTVPGAQGFWVAALLLGVGTQVWPMANAALVTSIASESQRGAALAATRSLRNAGMGAGALIATIAVSNGEQVMRLLAVFTGVGCVASALSVLTLVVPAATAQVPTGRGEARDALRGLRPLMIANLPFALCFDVLEVALPAVIVTRLHASPSWSSAIFVGNTVLVIVSQVAVVRRTERFARRSVFASSGGLLCLSYLGFWLATSWGGVGLLAVMSVVYSAGEIGYAGVGTALVVAAVPAPVIGRALARWQLSNGIGRAAAPLTLTALLSLGPAALWLPLALSTAVGSLAVLGPRLRTGSADSVRRDDLLVFWDPADSSQRDGRCHPSHSSPACSACARCRCWSATSRSPRPEPSSTSTSSGGRRQSDATSVACGHCSSC